MGTEAVWIPAVLAAAGAGAQAKATHDQAKDVDQAAAQGIRMGNERQRQADARVQQEVNKIGASTPEDSQREATNAFMEQLRRTKSQAYSGDSVGATSGAYAADTSQAANDVSNYGANRASVLGRINAPGLQRTAETVSRLRAGTDLNQIARAANGDEFLTQLRARSARANPWLVAGGQVLQGVGAGMASNGGYGTTKPPKAYGGTGYGSGPSADWGLNGGFGGGMNA